jgi:hypothetical protein
MASATQDDPLSTLLKKWIPYLPLPESTWLSLVAHNMVRKSGIVMATPRSIVDLVTVRLESLEAGVDFESLGGAPMLLSMIFGGVAGYKVSRHATWRTAHRSGGVLTR